MTTDSRVPLSPDINTLVDMLLYRASVSPDRQAHTFLSDGESEEASLTYAQLDRKARAIAVTLRQMQLEGERVVLLYPAGLEYIAALFGCFYAGAIAVPSYPPRLGRAMPRLESIVMDSGAKAALTVSSVLARLDHLSRNMPFLSSLQWLDTETVSETLAAEWQRPKLSADSLALLQYTSGSTSQPKGVMLTNANVLSNEAMIKHAFEQSEESVIFGWLPFYHDMGLIGNVIQPIYLGARSVLISPVAFLQRPLRWLQGISRYRATTSGGPNFAYDLCVRKIGEDERSRLDLSTWRTAFNGAEPIRASTIRAFTETFKSCGFRSDAFRPCYGLAEATLLVSVGNAPVVKSFDPKSLETNRAREVDEKDVSARHLVGSGHIAAQKALIVDPETMIESPAGAIGEIWVKGPNIAQGYWNKRELSQQTFAARLADSGEGPFLRTGDLGFLRDGELFVTGRLKDLIIIRGLNHYPQDIELTVEKTHDGLRQGCGAAFAVEADKEERLIIIQEIERHLNADPDNLLESIRRAVAEQHDIQPHAIMLVKTGSVPKTSSGKIKRSECRERFLADDFDPVYQWTHSTSSPAASAAPASAARSVEEVEYYLLTQVASMTGLEQDAIDVTKPLGAYGLDSIAAVNLAHVIENALDLTLPAATFLEGYSIAELARRSMAEPQGKRPESDSDANKLADAQELSIGQKSIWFLEQLAPEAAAYNIAAAARLIGRLNVPALHSAFVGLSDRHPMLRTSFARRDGNPIQVTQDHLDLTLNVEDASSLSHSDLMNRLKEQTYLEFDLERAPLFRVSLFKRSDEAHILLMVVHHIVADMWSLELLMHELRLLYTAHESGESAALPPLKATYADFARRQREAMEGPEGERLWEYWQKKLSGALPPLDLPVDRPRPPMQSFIGNSYGFKIQAPLTEQAKVFSKTRAVTLFTTLLAAFKSVLSRYTAQSDIRVISPTAGRASADLAGVVGYFVNPVVLRSDFSDDPTFEQLLERVLKTTQQALGHQGFPFSLLVERLRPERDPTASPLAEVVFTLQAPHLANDEAAAALALGESGVRMSFGRLELESVALEQQRALFDLVLSVAEIKGGLSAALQYNTDLFDVATIARMAGHFETFLAAALRDPGKRISQINLLTDSEKGQLLGDWNDTFVAYPQTPSVNRLIEKHAAEKPDGVAVDFLGDTLSYGELNGRANQLARHLAHLGAAREARVVICIDRSLELTVGLLGILKSGAAFVPLDPAHPTERLAMMMADSGATILITTGSIAERFAGRIRHVIRLDSDWQHIASLSNENLDVDTVPENLAYVIYTSGSTGTPKGVELIHKGMSNLVHWYAGTHEITKDDRVTLGASVGFDASVFEWLPCLAAGATLCVLDDETRLLPENLKRWLIEQAVTVTFLPTPVAESVLGLEWPRRVPLKVMTTGGDRLRVYPSPLLPFRLVNQYGPTESTVVTTAGVIGRPEYAQQPPHIGRPIANMQVYILDAQMNPTPVGVKGELYLTGDSLAKGYLNRPDLTAERFIPNPFAGGEGGRLYKTGDSCRYRFDGNVEFLDRLDNQVKVRGHRIELGEIESVLKLNDAVAEAVVIHSGRENQRGRLVGYIVAEPGATTSGQELREYLRERLPEYMVPTSYLMLESIPLTPNGKIDRRALAQLDESESDETTRVAPRSQIENDLALIWAEVLGLERVGVFDNFFDVGGHSLLATQLLARIKGRLSVEVPLGIFLKSPTIAALAEFVGQAAPTEGVKAKMPAIARVSRREHAAVVSDGRLVIQEPLKERLR
jgi:amino acid adenylation domain-containing protein